MITSLVIDPYVLGFLGISDTDAVGVSQSWVELAVSTTLGVSEVEAENFLDEINGFHQRVSARMASHLSLTAANIDNTSWLCANLLSTDAGVAREGANRLHEVLIRVRESSTPFEVNFVGNAILMAELQAFARAKPPCLLWRGRGAYANLFRFAAVRFRSAPDAVLDCEGVHARWKWLELMKRGMKFHLLNAMLKLYDFTYQFGELPEFDTLVPFLRDVVDGHKASVRSVVTDGVVAKGLRRESIYQHRFNLSVVEIDLIKAGAGPKIDPPQTPVTSLSNYVRFLFMPHRMYAFTKLAPNRYLYVAENKSFANRDLLGVDDAIGRPLAIAWFEETTDGLEMAMGGAFVAPVAGAEGTLELTHASIAELGHAAGLYIAMPANATARDEEIAIEATLLSQDIVSWEVVRADRPDHRACWGFVLIEPSADIEQYAFETRPLAELTKMALCRQLQLRDHFTDAQRGVLWSTQPKSALVAALADGGHLEVPEGGAHVDDAGIAAAAPPAPARARGRGRGRGARGGRDGGRGVPGRGRRGRGRALAA
jgi:hypothetical protein